MATIGNQSLTLADYASRLEPNGTAAKIIDLMSQTNDVLADMVWLPTNKDTSHKTTVRTGLPLGTWRMLYQGVVPTKSTTAQIEDACGNLEAYSHIDKDLADLNGNTAAFRLNEDAAFIEGLSQQMAEAIFYSSSIATPAQIMGFAPRYNALSGAPSTDNVINLGGGGSTNTSIWVVGWGPNSVHGIFPKAKVGGLQHRDLGEFTYIDPTQSGARYQAYQSHFKWEAGLSVRDWRYIVRIANIDVTTLNDPDTLEDILNALIAAFYKVPIAPGSTRIITDPTEPSGIVATGVRYAIYINRTIAAAVDRAALNKTNVLLRLEEWDGKPVTTFRGVPFRVVDKLLNTEAALT